jgi:photosystem II stability/assembly factor-like uncharacterized protein
MLALCTAAVLGCGGSATCPALSIDMQSLAAQASAIDVDIYDASVSCDNNDVSARPPSPLVSRHLDGHSGTQLELPAGHYVVVLHAFDANGVFIGSGCQSEIFTPGQHACVSIDLSPPTIQSITPDGDLGTGGTGGNGGGGGTTGGPDMGRPFETQTSGVTTPLYQPWAAGNGIVYAVGASGVILKTTDSGVTWTKQNSGTTQDLEAIWGTSATNVYIAGTRGTILHTTNGTSWSSMNQGTNDFWDVWGVNATDIYVTGTKGVYHSTGGAFSSLTTPAGAVYIGGAWGSAANDVYLFGENGLIEHGGAVGGFTKQTSNTTDNFNYGWGNGNDVWIPTRDSGDTSSRLMYSSDHGTTWTTQIMPTAAELWAVWSLPSTGETFLVGTNIQETTDHGTTWTTLPSPPATLFGVSGDPATGEIWTVGFNGLIMHRP